MSCKPKIKQKADTICTGDLKTRITIQRRRKVTSNDGSTDASLNISDLVKVWAMQVSSNGEEAFDSTNIIKVITDKFYIRYRNDIDITKILQKEEKGNVIKFKIIDIENLNGKNEFLCIRTTRRGDGTIKNNFV